MKSLRIFWNKAVNAFNTLSETNRVLILSFVVGVLVGGAAVLLKWAIHSIHSGLTSWTDASWSNWLMLIYPGIGMLLALLFTRYVIKDKIGHGVTKVLYAVSRNESKIKPHNMYSSLLASSVTIGFGGSVGAEAPIVYTGAAIGSNMARWFGLRYRSMTILLGCGAAAAVAGIFNAPLAGVLFTLEILLFNISMSSMMPLLISTVSATVVSYMFAGASTPFMCTLSSFDMHNIPFYLVLGLFCGFCSLYFLRTTMFMEDKIGKIRNPYLRWAICAGALGILIFLFPQLYGEGYDAIGHLLNGRDSYNSNTVLSFMYDYPWTVPAFFALVLVLKVFSMSFTNAGGGVGGTFGPTLFLGAIAGFVLARTINLAIPESVFSVPEQNFVLVGMAGLMAGVMQAPMTAIFLIAEISGGYQLLVPLIICAAISFGTTRLFEKYSIYTKRIAQAGDLLTHDNDKSVLTLLNINNLVRDKYPRVHENEDLKHVVSVISTDDTAVMAVVDNEGKFKGLIDIDHIRKFMFRADLYRSMHVSDIMEKPLATVYMDEKMGSVMDKFDKTEAWRLPVLDSKGIYMGFVSRSRILTAYRSELKKISGD